MKFLTHNGHQLVTKNKLEKAVQDYLKSMDRILAADNDGLKRLKKQILDDIDKLNEEHPRCKPIKPTWFDIDKNDWLLSRVNFSHFVIYHVKQDFL